MLLRRILEASFVRAMARDKKPAFCFLERGASGSVIGAERWSMDGAGEVPIQVTKTPFFKNMGYRKLHGYWKIRTCDLLL